MKRQDLYKLISIPFLKATNSVTYRYEELDAGRSSINTTHPKKTHVFVLTRCPVDSSVLKTQKARNQTDQSDIQEGRHGFTAADRELVRSK